MISLLPRSSPLRTTKPTSISSSSTTTTNNENTSSSTVSTAPLVDITPDAFQDPEIFAQAEQRWAIGSESTVFAPIVHRQGRPEIADLAAEMVKTRISNGIIQQKAKKHNTNEVQNVSSGIRNRYEKSSPNPHLHKFGQAQEEVPLWLKHKVAIKEKLQGERWNPVKKVTRHTMEEMRYLRKQFPEEWTADKLAGHFNISSEAVRRIIRTDGINVIDSVRAQEQDATREKARKANVKASLTQLAQQKHAEYLERKAKREELKMKNTKAPSGRIKLGAPKRSIQ
ncbi:hypothetical protein EMPS_00749 [Entomortierella parvispora]|uniref:Required for respiratory growth protein 9, mitochondrial n=1 Tax=Entomortierella parvispora TaxID=205924 RepID=A0A9P3H1I6_9FUNG|nr:hypothetical protein EMPS_00749 [Entomortierella parvispora]